MIGEYLSEHWMKTGSAAVALLATLTGAGYSTFSWHDSRYSKQLDVQLIEMRLEQKILSDRQRQTQQRIWQIEDRYDGKVQDAPDTVQEEYRDLKQELEDITAEMNEVRREQRRMYEQNPSRYYDRERKAGR